MPLFFLIVRLKLKRMYKRKANIEVKRTKKNKDSGSTDKEQYILRFNTATKRNHLIIPPTTPYSSERFWCFSSLASLCDWTGFYDNPSNCFQPMWLNCFLY